MGAGSRCSTQLPYIKSLFIVIVLGVIVVVVIVVVVLAELWCVIYVQFGEREFCKSFLRS